MIAGTSETPGTVLRDSNGQFYKMYGGSASGENKGHTQFVEGVMKTIPFRGKVKYILREIHDGIASAFSYVGANTLQEFQQKCEFIYLTPNSTKESKI
jgi:IMP dehydrogenase